MQASENLNSMFFVWWYAEVGRDLLAFIKQFFIYLADLFSVEICFKTLLSPWRRDKISYEGLALKDRFQVLILNLSSRLIGAVVKLFTVATFLFVSLFSVALSVLVLIVWAFYPVVLLGLIVWGLKIIFIGI